MLKRIPVKKNQSILFICYGNVCRSPMAEGLAKKKFLNNVQIESAGLAPVFDAASPEAVEVMREFFESD